MLCDSVQVKVFFFTVITRRRKNSANRALHPRAVIAGHKRPGNDDSPRIIEETRQYIRDFDRIAGTTTTARELYDQMLSLYPDRINPGRLWDSARALKPEEGKTA